MPLRTKLGIVLVTLTSTAMLGACGSDGSGSATTAPAASAASTTLVPPGSPAPEPAGTTASSTAPTGSEGPTAGCTSAATQRPARCRPGSPEPQPLAERKVFRLASGTQNNEYMAVVMLGLAKGEFDKENIELELHTMPGTEGLQLMSQGDLEADALAPDAGFINAVAQGFNLRWVLGNYSTPGQSKAGFWARDGVTIADLKGKSVGSVVGPGSMTNYPISLALETAGLTPADVTFQKLEVSSIVQALENGAVAAAWLNDPLWVPLADSGDYTFLAGQPEGEPLGGIMFGPTVLRDDPELGQAFVRAYIRTINTYFAGDYKADAAFVAELADVLKVTVDQLTQVPANVWDWEIRDGTTDRVQAVLGTLPNVLISPTPVAESELVDRSFYQQVVEAG